MKFPLAGPSYESQSLIQMGARTINMYREIVGVPGGKSTGSLYPCPGLTNFATTSYAGGRAIFTEPQTSRVFAICGAGVDEINSDGTVTARGAVAVDTNPAQMASNGNGQLFMVSGTQGYLLTLSSNVLTNPVSNVGFCGMVDTFLVALDPVTGTMKISEASDGATWDPGQVVQRSAAADPWAAMIVLDREIYLIGSKSGEVFFNSGASPFPFALRPGSFFEVGIEATFSIGPLGSSFAWLGGSARGGGRVYAMNGYTPVPISNEALEWAIAGYRAAGTVSDAIGWGYDAVGHSFYVLEFPTAKRTWVFDGVTKEWHERGKWSPDDNMFLAYRPRFQTSAFRRNLVLDSQQAKVYSLSNTVYTDVGGSVLRRVRRLPHVSNENRPFSLDYLELECARGVGLTQGQGVDPLVMMSVSWDGGDTFGNERTASLGKKGQTTQRVRVDRWGKGRDLVVELSATDPVPQYWLDLYAGIS